MGHAQISDARKNLHKTGIDFVCTDAQKECQASGRVLNYKAAKRITSEGATCQTELACARAIVTSHLFEMTCDACPAPWSAVDGVTLPGGAGAAR
jgi:hypothetical protein